MGGRSTVQYYGYSAIEGKAETENYEKDNLPVRYSISDERYIDYTYDSLNRLIGKTLSLASPLSYSYVYKTSQRGSGYTTSLIGRENIGDSFYRYTYDGLGNITNILSGTLSDSDSQSSYRRYTYDALNQLVREDNETTGETYAYIYDDYGNITQKKVYTRTFEALEEKTPKQVITYSYGVDTDAGWKKLLKSYNGEAIDYDEIGNPTTYRGATLDWNERQLKSYTVGNDLTVTYKYDADGLRASKTVNGEKTTYQYVSGKLMYEDRNGTDIYYYYDSYGTPVSIRYYEPDGTSYRFYLATNQQGDVIGIYNASGNMVVKYEYDAWGNIIAETNANGDSLNSLAQKWSDINPFRYRGYYYDSETGLYYLQSRYYDAETGRFINADVLLDNRDLNTINPFIYCGNNPVNSIDANGESLEWLSKAWNKCVDYVSGVKDKFVYVNNVLSEAVSLKVGVGTGFSFSGEAGLVGLDASYKGNFLEIVIGGPKEERGLYSSLEKSASFDAVGFEIFSREEYRINHLTGKIIEKPNESDIVFKEDITFGASFYCFLGAEAEISINWLKILRLLTGEL